MILANQVVWKKREPIPISNIAIGDKISVLNSDKTVGYSEVKSIIPVFSTYYVFEMTGGPPLALAVNTLVLTDKGMATPTKGDLVVCGSAMHRVIFVKEMLTRRQFYDIMIADDLPVIIQEGYCIKVKAKK